VPGIEYSDPDNVVHIPVWGAGAYLGTSRPTDELLADVDPSHTIAVLAHPKRRDAWRRLEPSWTRALYGIEIWNRKYDGVGLSEAGLDLLRRHGSLRATVGLDYHRDRQLFPMTLHLPGRRMDARALVDRALHPSARWTVGGVSAERLASPSGQRMLALAERARAGTLRAIRGRG
jgi:hypothetical protein